MPAVLTAILLLNPIQAPRVYNGKLDQFYTIGEVARVIGTGERLNFNLQRQIAFQGAYTTLAVGTYLENVVAPAGKQLVIFRSTIRNHQSGPITVGSAEAYGLRVFDANLQPGSVSYVGSFNSKFGELKKTLQKGDSIDVASVYIFPDSMPHLRVAPFFRKYYPKESPHYDLSKLLPNSKSAFTKTPLIHLSKAKSRVGNSFEFEELGLKVLGTNLTEDGGIGVQVEFTTQMQKPVSWGWQYAKAELVSSEGDVQAAFPNFYPSPGYEDWGLYIHPGKKVVGEYRFYPKGVFTPKEFRLTKIATERQVIVDL